MCDILLVHCLHDAFEESVWQTTLKIFEPTRLQQILSTCSACAAGDFLLCDMQSRLCSINGRSLQFCLNWPKVMNTKGDNLIIYPLLLGTRGVLGCPVSREFVELRSNCMFPLVSVTVFKFWKVSPCVRFTPHHNYKTILPAGVQQIAINQCWCLWTTVVVPSAQMQLQVPRGRCLPLYIAERCLRSWRWSQESKQTNYNLIQRRPKALATDYCQFFEN